MPCPHTCDTFHTPRTPTPQVRGAYSKLYQQRMRIEQRNAKGQWGTTTGDDDIREVPSADLVPLSRGIEELDKRHHRGIAEFTQKLPSQVGGRGAWSGGGIVLSKGGIGQGMHHG